MKQKKFRSNESGQALTEYVLLLALVVGFFITISKGLALIHASDMILRPVKEEYARSYRYGHPKAKGFDDGGPEFHPRAETGSKNNFRIFINPDLGG